MFLMHYLPLSTVEGVFKQNDSFCLVLHQVHGAIDASYIFICSWL